MELNKFRLIIRTGGYTMRTLNAKNPGRPYAPRFLDDKNLKAAVEEELYDISKVLEQNRQEFNYVSEATYENLGSWDPLTNSYPKHNGRNAQWDVILSSGKSHTFDGKNWETHQKLLYLRSTNEYLQIIDPSKFKMIQQIESISVEVDNAQAGITHLEQVIATTNLALAETEDRLQAQITNVSTDVDGQQVDIDKLKSDLIITNTTLATTNMTMAQNKTELNSRIDGVETKTNNNTTSIGSLNSSLTVTNQTVSTIQSTMATNYTTLNSKIDGVKTTVDGHTTSIGSLNSTLSTTNQTLSTLQSTVATNYTTLDSKITGVQTTVNGHTTSIGSLNSTLSTTNQTLSTLQSTVATNYTTLDSKITGVQTTVNGHTTSITNLNSGLSTTNQTVTNLTNTTASNKTELQSQIDDLDTITGTHTTNIASLSSQMTTYVGKTDGMYARWVLKTNVNGKISGIDLLNNGSTSTFDVVADSFKVYNGTTSVAPFEVVGGATKIKNAIIGDVQSDNWNETTKAGGWKIYKDGTAYFNSATISGDVVAKSFRGVVLNTLVTDVQATTSTTEGVYKKVMSIAIPMSLFEDLPNLTRLNISGFVPIICTGNGYFKSTTSTSSTEPPTYYAGARHLKVKSGTGSTYLLPFSDTYTLESLRAQGVSNLYVYAVLCTVADMGFGGGSWLSEVNDEPNMYPATISLYAPSVG